MRVLIVEDETFIAEGIRDFLRLEAIAADIAGDGDTALELLAVNDYDLAVLNRDIPGPSGDEIARGIVTSGSGLPILMLTAEVLPTLVEPFRRAAGRIRTDEHAGVGLGLAIVERIVSVHGGALVLTPLPAGGLRAEASFCAV